VALSGLEGRAACRMAHRGLDRGPGVRNRDQIRKFQMDTDAPFKALKSLRTRPKRDMPHQQVRWVSRPPTTHPAPPPPRSVSWVGAGSGGSAGHRREARSGVAQKTSAIRYQIAGGSGLLNLPSGLRRAKNAPSSAGHFGWRRADLALSDGRGARLFPFLVARRPQPTGHRGEPSGFPLYTFGRARPATRSGSGEWGWWW
jgi:hypothetical protein